MKKVVVRLMAIIAFAVGLQVQAYTPSKLNVRVIGEGQPMIMIPGLTCDGAVWDTTIEALGDQYQYHVLTLPGFAGQAPLADVEAGFFNQIKSLVYQYIEENQLEKPIIVGHSLGGFLALQIGIEKPDLAEKLVVVDALPFMTAIQMPTATEESAKPFAQNMKTQMKAAASQTDEQKRTFQQMQLQSLIRNKKYIETATNWGVSSDMNTVAQAMYEMYTTDIRADLAKIKVPTLVLGAWAAYESYGSTKESVMNMYKAQYAKHPNLKLDISEGGYHFIMWDDPEFFLNWLNKFL
ncbi:alpha/beta fold hydrolase [Roseivirga thermotolerans]|uniref:alpha/beta fold hydrolase n=1 Tax=Roseivirga thermotolerans TaxID=1758176 RepID=UPI00273E352B|nr:alpha/beta hydrolase [Roseivirga thermotolerans]